MPRTLIPSHFDACSLDKIFSICLGTFRRTTIIVDNVPNLT
jgi:hypothetical protein